jgi:uncharacterized protein YbdZ (MbtH family)
MELYERDSGTGTAGVVENQKKFSVVIEGFAIPGGWRQHKMHTW